MASIKPVNRTNESPVKTIPQVMNMVIYLFHNMKIFTLIIKMTKFSYKIDCSIRL